MWDHASLSSHFLNSPPLLLLSSPNEVKLAQWVWRPGLHPQSGSIPFQARSGKTLRSDAAGQNGLVYLSSFPAQSLVSKSPCPSTAVAAEIVVSLKSLKAPVPRFQKEGGNRTEKTEKVRGVRGVARTWPDAPRASSP